MANRPPTLEQLIVEAEAAPVEGCDFSWLDGRATEKRPSWGYSRTVAQRMQSSRAALDVHTGGGEFAASLHRRAPLMVATEAWPPNVQLAARRLGPLGIHLVAASDRPPGLPLRSESFDLIISRHPVTTRWAEVARLLRPGGTFLSQQVGTGTVEELVERFLGPGYWRSGRTPERERSRAEQAGLVVVDLRAESLRTVFYDIGAVVYFLRKVIWNVPDFSVERYRTVLASLHQEIQERGSFVTHAHRFLIEARKPAGS
jgi:SAM-dependent methyltransferase